MLVALPLVALLSLSGMFGAAVTAANSQPSAQAQITAPAPAQTTARPSIQIAEHTSIR